MCAGNEEIVMIEIVLPLCESDCALSYLGNNPSINLRASKANSNHQLSPRSNTAVSSCIDAVQGMIIRQKRMVG